MRRSNPRKALLTTQDRHKGNDSPLKGRELFRRERGQALFERIGHKAGAEEGNLEARVGKTQVDDPTPMIRAIR